MGDPAGQLRRALGTDAPKESAVLILFHGTAADRAHLGNPVRHRTFRAFGQIHLQNFGNDLPCLPDEHRVADSDITLGDEILIVQRGIGHRGSRKANGTDDGLGGQDAGSAHLDNDVFHHGRLDLRRVFIGGCPAGEFCRAAQALPEGQRIHLDDGAVNVAGELSTVFIDGGDLIADRRNAG